MKKDIVYKIIIGILLTMNLLQLAGFLFKEKLSNPHKKFDEKAAQIMDLNKKQQKQFSDFAKKHKAQMDSLQKKQMQFVSKYFKQTNDSLLDLICVIEIEKIKATEQHFDDIKSILNKNQYPKFKQFKKDALKNILQKNTRKPPFPKLK